MPVINDYNHCDEFTCVALAGELSHGITKLPNYNCLCATNGSQMDFKHDAVLAITNS